MMRTVQRFNVGEGDILPSELLGENRLVFSSLSKCQKEVKKTQLTIKYVLEGEEKYYFNQNRLCIPAGHWTLFNAESNYIVDFEGNELNKGLCIYLNRLPSWVNVSLSELYEEIELHTTVKKEGLNFGFEGESIHCKNDSIDMLIRDLQHDRITSSEFILSLLSFIIEYDYSSEKKIDNLGVLKQTTFRELQKRLITAKNAIIDHRDRVYTLQDLSRDAMVSEFHLLRSFKQYFGVTPMKMHQNYKMAYAKEQLSAEASSISDLSHRLGYSNLSAFSRSYKLYHGFSPQNTN